MSESPKVLASFEITDGVALIKLDDGKANALSLPMQQAFNSALDQAQQAKLPVVITGRSGILSAGFDLKTLAASGIAGFGKILKHVEENAPLRRNVTIDDVGNAAAFLLSDLAAGITGEITHVDSGFSTVVGGMPGASGEA